MSTIQVNQTTTATPEQLVAALTDFGPGRSELFPRSADRYLKVHDLGPGRADGGDGDLTIPTRLSHLMAGPIPARVRIYPDSAHAFLFQEPEQVGADINAFLD